MASTGPVFRVIKPGNWDDARRLARQLVNWTFRGQGDASWPLGTSIERGISIAQGSLEVLSDRESQIIREFQRRAHHYLPDPPATEKTLEWLALIQHHGGPTRLLDFTYSFYVAAFFAIDDATRDAAVWAVNYDLLLNAISSHTGFSRKPVELMSSINARNVLLAEHLIGSNNGPPLVIPVEPERLNERLSIQQGLFLFPCRADESFMTNLLSTFGIQAEHLEQEPEIFDRQSFWGIGLPGTAVAKIVIPRSSHRTVLEELRTMNIHAATLFPGLDGFARSLKYYLKILEEDSEFAQRYL